MVMSVGLRSAMPGMMSPLHSNPVRTPPKSLPSATGIKAGGGQLVSRFRLRDPGHEPVVADAGGLAALLLGLEPALLHRDIEPVDDGGYAGAALPVPVHEGIRTLAKDGQNALGKGSS